LEEVFELYRKIIGQPIEQGGLHDLQVLESSLAQPFTTFDGKELYPTIVDKAAILGYSIISNHPFVDGNKRVGHAAIETYLILNGFEIEAQVEEQEKMILDVASGKISREEFTNWLELHIVKRSS
jgi:death-on-curing protein